MPQVSKRLLVPKTQERIFDLFITSIVMCNSKELAHSLATDLFTYTERIMLSKRFSIAFMLSEGYDYTTIIQTLKVSGSTVSEISAWLKEKGTGFRTIIKSIKKREVFKKVLDEVKDAAEDFIASVPGQNWSDSKSILWKNRKQRQKAF